MAGENHTARQHIAGLDALRGVAIVLVMLRHYVTIDERQGVLGAAFATACSFGWIGVDAFFVISGYLITRILLLAKNDCSFFMPFYVRRMFRIMPLYCVFLLTFTGARASDCSPDFDCRPEFDLDRINSPAVRALDVLVILEEHPNRVPRVRVSYPGRLVVARNRGAVLPALAAVGEISDCRRASSCLRWSVFAEHRYARNRKRL